MGVAVRKLAESNARPAASTIYKHAAPHRNAAAAAARQPYLRTQLTLISWFLEENLLRLVPHWASDEITVFVLPTQGWSNLAFRVQVSRREEFIVRLKQMSLSPDQIANSPYHKEAYVLGCLPQSVPVPHMLPRGLGYIDSDDPRGCYIYIVQRFIPYGSAGEMEFSRREELDFYTRIGRVAAQINATPARGFGRTFDGSRGAFQLSSWEEWMMLEMHSVHLSKLRDCGLLSAETSSHVQARLLELSRQPVSSTFYHLDLLNNWSNVLVDRHHKIQGIIDWEFAGGGLGFEQDVAWMLYVFARDEVPPAEARARLNALLQGYEMPPSQFRAESEQKVKALLLLNSLYALNYFRNLKEKGQVHKEPFRETFARRASALIDAVLGNELQLL